MAELPIIIVTWNNRAGAKCCFAARESSNARDGFLSGDLATGSIGLGGIPFCGAMFRFKYRGSAFLKVYRLRETVGFPGFPFVYLRSLRRGCARYRVIGAMW
jgi:hypothetical protein